MQPTSKNAIEANPQNPCPACSGTSWCLRFPDGSANCYRAESGLEREDRQGSLYWHHPAQDGAEPVMVMTEQPNPERATADQLDRAYRSLQDQLSLSNEHKAGLIERGLSEATIASRGFRSLGPPVINGQAAAHLAEVFPFWQKVPGLVLRGKESNAKPALSQSKGLLLFLCDLDGRVQAVQVRADDAELLANPDRPRYTFLSSSSQKGPSARACPSWWGPVGLEEVEAVRITEGAFKALLAFDCTQVPSIAAGAGVGSMASPEILDWLERLAPKRVLFTPDQDAYRKTEVARVVKACLQRLMAFCQTQGIQVLVETWQTDLPPDQRHKGIDDALQQGLEVVTIPATEYLAGLPFAQPEEERPPDGHEEATTKPLDQTLEGALCALSRARDQIKPKDLQALGACMEAASRGTPVMPKARKKVLTVVQRYEGLLVGLGVNVHDVTAAELAAREASESEESKKDPTHQADLLLEMAGPAKLFKSGSHHYLSTLRTNPDGSFARETVRFNDRGNGVDAWLTYNYYQQKGKAPSSEAIKAAKATLEARCEFEGGQERVWLRVAETGDAGDRGDSDRRLFHDLGGDLRKVVVISSEGWQVTQDVPVYFWRPKSLQALPEPVRGGSLEELRQFLNVPDESSWILLVSFLLFCFIPTTPHPLLILEGEEGSCKTWAARFLRMLVDPNGALTRRPPRNEEDLSLYALNSHLPCIDNIATIEEWLSDGLCAITTGNGWGRRAKFTDEAESVVSVVRPVIMTGLNSLHGKSDLLDRTIKVILKRVQPSKRLTEGDLQKAFEEARPRILGAIYDVLVVGLRNRGKVPLPELPRLADFARFIVEAEEALPWRPGQFIEAFRAHRLEQVLTVLESDPLAGAIKQMIDLSSSFEGTVNQLYSRLSEFRGSKIPAPHLLKNCILKLRPNLRHLGIEVSEKRSKSARLIRIEKTNSKPVAEDNQAPEASITRPVHAVAKGFDPELAAQVRDVGELF